MRGNQVVKEVFVFPALCELWSRPRHQAAHTDINDKYPMLILLGRKNTRGLKPLVKKKNSHQIQFAVPSSSVLDFKAKDKMLKLLVWPY